ncbi:hypothetical protein ARMGADRAFT_1032993 [Armillaria gallica]|uniref:Uncharacterized protein n=1 Tax=Armillaria gallica TaxID=47427 RepID=A0A2H3DGE7_ARMGA|nr:hypothetical protein ARMGADRAFT_1032993 [Armillaria gallica]
MTSPERFPVLSSLPPPSDLFKSTAPYILTVSLYDQNLVVHCSHEPTLKLLKGYLERHQWTKAHSVVSSKLTLVESDFCPGTMDTLIVSPNSSWERNCKVNPTVILAFIEGVVGYRMVSTTGSIWMYRRTTLFT